MERVPLLVFSHLRWDFVFQRPQHVMTRLARRRDIVFVEEPRVAHGAPRLEVVPVGPGVRVARATVPMAGPGFGPAQDDVMVELLHGWLGREGLRDFAAWLYTPMAVRIARALGPRALLYDCMDELSAFLGAPPELLQREHELLAHADAVFTGGPSLYRAKRDRHPFVRCFPSSVDQAHFARAGRAPEPREQASLPRPRLGYYGVIDERLDPALLEALSAAHPEWSIVMVGPVVKITPATLPRRPNLHYLGQRDYADLPGFLTGWDACLMPFALGPATRYISPTKVLEYMAADRPIVSTPITDVAEPYGDIVHLGRRPEEFVAACERALSAPAAERAKRRQLARRVLERTSWEETVRRMEEIVRYLADSGLPQAVAPAAGARRVEVRA
jgi:UDP-galactopyranose mutase